MQKILLGFCLVVTLPSLSGQLTETGKRVSLTDGNDLYQWCQAYKEAVKLKGEGFSVDATETSTAFKAGHCMGYVRGIVDSLPAGGDFSPGPKVKLTQYIDVTFKYLDEHPELRDKSARILVEDALVNAFPKR